MHIPDGYLSPQTYIPFYGLVVPFLAVAARRVRTTFRSRQVPMLALGAAFSFVVMMFNIPMPGGTTGHAVGAVIVAILLGPWAASVAISIAVVVQALFFGDGGLTSLGANCFNMAIVMPFIGYYSYRAIAGNSPLNSKRRGVASAVAGYLALNMAALYTALECGIQPLIAAGPDGRPLYAPFPLSIAVPAMTLGHLLLFGVVEGIVTCLVIRYVQKLDPELLGACRVRGPARAGSLKALWVGIAGLALVSPLGLILPAVFRAGGAWGEWGPEEIGKMMGYVPSGMEKTATVWHSPLADYSFRDWQFPGLPGESLGYVVSAFAGIGVILAIFWFWGRCLAGRADE